MKKAIRDAYGETLVKLGETNKNIVVLDADVSSSTKSALFAAKYPERFFNVGVAEANMAGMAAGLATCGFIPFINTFAAFMVLRAADPIRTLGSYGGANIKIAGAYAGLSDSYDGATHHSIDDISFMRALPGMTVISVGDPIEAEKAVAAAAEIVGPVYLRLSRADHPYIYDENYNFQLGKGVVLRDGSDVTLVATGYMVSKAIEAAEKLNELGISARVVNIHTIKPIDSELIVRCAKETGCIVTIEEHSIYGGLGSAVTEVVTSGYPVPVEIIGIADTYAESGDYEKLLHKYGLSSDAITGRVTSFVKKTKA
jgi:transketolase